MLTPLLLAPVMRTRWPLSLPLLQILLLICLFCFLEKKRKDYAFWRQFNEKPSIVWGCSGILFSVNASAMTCVSATKTALIGSETVATGSVNWAELEKVPKATWVVFL